jgi:hypothetical protein
MAPDLMLRAVRAGLAGAPLPALPEGRGLVHLTARAGGRPLRRLWAEGGDLAAALAAGLAEMPEAKTLELTFAGPAEPLHPKDLTRAACNLFRALQGLEMRAAGRVVRISPLEMITRNLGPNAALERLAAELDHPKLATRWRFGADQWLLDLSAGRAMRLFRGQVVLPQAAVTAASVADMAAAMQGWMLRQVGESGATTYKYWPASGKYSNANNMVRQFMASACLALAARRDAGAVAAMERNFRYNFSSFYREEADFGIIDEAGKVKLGAAAVAVMAILNRPDPAPYGPQLDRLTRFILMMQQENGRFRTFLRPENRDDNHNFYPGEALLALAMLHDRRPDPMLATRIRAGFQHYRAWHREQPNPAFIPWHVQAYARFFRCDGDAEMASFAFEMSDWLVTLQQHAGPPDARGEFFTHETAHFGPPHASSTGVYLEGLIEAFALARDLGQAARADRYRHAILKGLRSLMQLQFRDEGDMFYLSRRERVAGGLRTATFDNTIRLDNVQHGLMAIWRILEEFQDGDYRL